jgi:hypothetical protein
MSPVEIFALRTKRFIGWYWDEEKNKETWVDFSIVLFGDQVMVGCGWWCYWKFDAVYFWELS